MWMTEDGECYDEMNRNLWVATFNIIMQARRHYGNALQWTTEGEALVTEL